METNSLDLLTKLMANENITVLRQKVSTASFDIVNRVLRLPVLVNMTPIEETMMGFHEVGHALFTDNSYLDLAKKDKKRNFSSYMNILEDVRIERMMKERYPGCRKDFFAGYKSLNERDFFGVSGKDLSTLVLIDRINLYFKAGVSSGVKFNKEERVFIRDAEKANSVQEVYDLACRVYAFAAEQEKKKKEESTEELGFDEPDDSDDEFDFDYEDTEEEDYDGDVEDNSKVPNTAGEEDVAPESETQEEFNSRIENNTSLDGLDFVYVMPKNYYEPIVVDCKTIVKEFRAGVRSDEEIPLDALADFDSFKKNNNKVVAHLVKEFEMRKAAHRYSRKTVAQSGSISMRDIHKYKTSDDIFRKLDVVFDDSNHSFLMLLDWSGSMQSNLSDSIGQVITLASFCRRVKIAFQVCAFSDNRNTTVQEEASPNTSDRFALVDGRPVNILTFFDSRMSNSDFDYMAKQLYTGNFWRFTDSPLRYKYSLGGTPLIESLVWLYDYIDEFKKLSKAEKMTVITVTDGEGQHVSVKSPVGDSRWSRSRFFLRCSKTAKTYPFSHRIDMQNSALAICKNANPEVKFVGFFVSSGNKRALVTFNTQNDSRVSILSTITSAIRRDGYFNYPSPNYHNLFVIPGQNRATDVEISDVTENMTANQLAKKLTNSVGSAIKSRVVLSRFIEQIA